MSLTGRVVASLVLMILFVAIWRLTAPEIAIGWAWANLFLTQMKWGAK